jgi:hypothetical protein
VSKRLVIAILCAVHLPVASAAVISQVISPNSIVVESGKARAVAEFGGEPVLYCGLQAFKRWAAPLVGQVVRATPIAGLSVTIAMRDVPLEPLLVAAGWIEPTVLDDDAQAAIAEGRGGWACAGPVAPFRLMHTSVDPKILAGIALNESGLGGRAWPWTLNVAGRGFFFKSRKDAYEAIRSLVAAHRCDFDVGIMQVNWCYHANLFTSPWAALEPATNIHVAESILNENYRRTHSVAKAVAFYHSANPVPGNAYLARFARHLKQIDAGI